MIASTGKGNLSVVVVFISIFVSSALLSLFPTNLSLYGGSLGLFIGGAFSLIYGYKWNSQEKERVLIDEKSGEKIRVKNSHTLLLIKMEYWGIIFFILGIILLFQYSILLGIISIFVFLVFVLVFYMNVKKRKQKEEEKINEINEIFKRVINESDKKKE